MKLPATLLLTYQAEYEQNPDMTIADLCEKYDVQTKQLKGYTKWQKKAIEINKLPEPAEPMGDILVTETNSHNIVIPKSKDEILSEIETFKKLAIKHAVKFIKDDAQFAEVKEFKDMVAIVDSIEKSYKDTKDPAGTTINIAIQNLVERFKDDC